MTPNPSTPTSGDIVEDVEPGNRPVLTSTAPTHDQTTRKAIAITVLSIVGALYIGAALSLITHWINANEFTLLATMISGPQALAAAVIGFYYGKRKG